MIRTDMENALYTKLKVGESVRIVHEYDVNDVACSIGKDAAMVVTRTIDGLKWYCHRCESGGHTRMDSLSPERTAQIIKRIKDHKDHSPKRVRPLQLPKDANIMYDCELEWIEEHSPPIAREWFEQYGLDTSCLNAANVVPFWSASESRVIFPIYQNKTELIAWNGRSLDPRAKRNGKGKYKNIKRKDQERVLFKLESPESDKVVFTEDILSAIKVFLATGYNTIALLTTHIDVDTIAPYKNCEIYLWLDGDMKVKSTLKIRRFNALGWRAHSIKTNKDPKEYNPTEIRGIIDGE